MKPTGDPQIRAERGTLERICGDDGEAGCNVVFEARLDAAPFGRRDILKVSFASQCTAADKDDVVGCGCRESRERPVDCSRRTAQSALPRSGRDLIQRRVGDKRVRQTTRIFRVGAGDSTGVGTREDCV